MSDAAPSAPAATPAPNAAAPAAEPAKAESAAEVAPDPKESLDAHVAHAIKVAKRQASTEKAKATKAEKAAAKKPEPAKAAPAKATEPEAEAEESEPEAEAKPARSGKTPRQLLEEGDIDGAFLEAFGKKPGDLNINSKRWSEHHKAVKRDREKLQQQTEQSRQQIAAEHRKIEQLLHAAREEVRPYKDMIEAKRLYKEGKVAEAVKMAFEDDASEFNKKIIRGAHGKNPEVEAVREELRALKAEQERERQEYAQQVQRQKQAQIDQANINWVAENLPTVEDYDYSGVSKKPAFLKRVVTVLEEHFDPDTNTTLPLAQAADMVRQEWEENFGASFAPRGAAVTATSVRGGSNLARPEGKPSKTLSQQGAAEASAPTRGAHGLSLDDHVRMFTNGAAH